MLIIISIPIPDTATKQGQGIINIIPMVRVLFSGGGGGGGGGVGGGGGGGDISNAMPTDIGGNLFLAI